MVIKPENQVFHNEEVIMEGKNKKQQSTFATRDAQTVSDPDFPKRDLDVFMFTNQPSLRRNSRTSAVQAMDPFQR